MKTSHQRKKIIVLVGGCFDVLHYGHIEFLRQAKQLGSILKVALESDENVTKGKDTSVQYIRKFKESKC